PAISSSRSASEACSSILAARLIWSERSRVITRWPSSSSWRWRCSASRWAVRAPSRTFASPGAARRVETRATTTRLASQATASRILKVRSGMRRLGTTRKRGDGSVIEGLDRFCLYCGRWLGSVTIGGATASSAAPGPPAAAVRPPETAMTEAHAFVFGLLLAWMAGIRAYLTVFGVGLAGLLGWVDLPPALEATQSWWVLGTSGALALAEF